MKNAKNNGKVVEITAMNARLRASTASLVQQHLSSYANPPGDYQAIAKLAPFHSVFLRNDQARGSSASELYSEMQSNLATLNNINTQTPSNVGQSYRIKLSSGTPFIPDFNLRSIILQTLNNSAQKQDGKTYQFSSPATTSRLELSDDFSHTLRWLATKHARLDADYKSFLAWGT